MIFATGTEFLLNDRNEIDPERRPKMTHKMRWKKEAYNLLTAPQNVLVCGIPVKAVAAITV